MVVVPNPVQAVNELAQFMGKTFTKDYLSVGDVHTPKFTCTGTLFGFEVVSPAQSTKDEALKWVCAKILSKLPFAQVPPECVVKAGDAHQAVYTATYAKFTTPSFLKRVDACKSLMHMVLTDCLGVESFSVSNLSIIENTLLHQEEMIKKALLKWQTESLPRVVKILSIDAKNEEVKSYLTAAFILSGFCQSTTEKDAVKNFLGIPEFNNERLETLGDSVIGLGAALKFFNQGMTPGEITLNKSGLVSETRLAQFVTQAGLDEYFITRDKFPNYSAKTKSDVFEAIVGAVFLADVENRDVCAEHFIGLLVHQQ